MRTVLLFLAALLTFCACSDDPEPTGQYLATIRLNELYGEKSIGEWQNDSVYPDGNMISEYMQLDADKQAKYVFQVGSPAPGTGPERERIRDDFCKFG